MMSSPESRQQWHARPRDWRSAAWNRIAKWAARHLAGSRLRYLVLSRLYWYASSRTHFVAGEPVTSSTCPHRCVEICRHWTSLDGGACMYGHQPEELLP